MRTAWTIVAFALLRTVCAAQEAIDYPQQVKRVLQARCYACHGALKQEAGLRVDTVALMQKGSENGTVIVAGQAQASSLLKRISAVEESERMPPEGEPLKADEIEAIRLWINQGAKAPANEQPERDPRDHWAFRSPVRRDLPVSVDPAWGKNPVDAWISAGHQKHGLTPVSPADKRIWLRRVSLDLIGLPPTDEELDAFAADQSAAAYERVVTRLLDSPQYGERWGRHWMDIWRYSDWWGLGAEVRNSQKHIWHWRDWVIESLNSDKGYDQMLREMIAADELYPNDLDKLRGSGFLARQYFKFNRTSWLDETIEHTSKAMLGLTLNCAKCHDHKYDPISQLDYYRFRAIFEPYQVRTDLLPGETDFEKDGLPRAFDCNLDAQTFLHVRGDDRNPDTSRALTPAVPAILMNDKWTVSPVDLPSNAFQPALRSFVVDAYLKQAHQRNEAASAALREAEQQYAKAIEAEKLAADRLKQVADAPADALSAIAMRLVMDDFAAERPDVWEARDGMWAYANGRLKQSLSAAARSVLRLKQPVPADFEARLKYIPTGGNQWKSVGITFDVTDSGNEALAYLSSYADGPKSQVSYKQGGNYVYPAEGMQARPVELNKPHELILRVRGTLVNIVVDGQQSVAYRLPIARQAGRLEVITFDATAELLEFELRELPVTARMDEPVGAGQSTGSAPPTRSATEAQLALEIARKALATAESQPASIRARAAAEIARTAQPVPDDLAHLIATAVRAERIASAAKADEDVSRAQWELMIAPADKRPEAEKKLATAKETLEAARKAIDMPGESYSPIVGSVKTAESNLETEDSRRKPFPKTSTGRRSALALWLTDPQHPLTARVAVNHLWSRHFGRPLVPTIFDFGRKGTPPTHPELLDWLAAELMDHQWSMKHIHRLIVLSNTYRLSSSNASATDQTIAADPDNRYYWRTGSNRMEAQVVRDSLLYLAGDLDLTRGGPPIPVASESNRRSLYFFHSHNEHQKFLSIFDDANVLECYRRSESIVPQQALALENSPLASMMAEKIARRIGLTNPSDHDFIRSAFLTVLSAEPTEDELAVVQESLARLIAAAKTKNRPDPEADARTSIIHALLNHNDFVTVR